MVYPGLYPRLLVTPVFAYEGDFMWIEKIVCMYDSDLDDVEEPEFEFHRDTAHYEKNERLQAENTKLRDEVERLQAEYAKLRERAVAELSELRGVVSEGDYDSPSGRYFLLRRDVAAYEDALRELGIEV